MRRKYPLLITLFFVCSYSYAQSLSFENLLSLTSMSSAQAHDFLVVAKGFKATGTQAVNGKNMEEYKIIHGTADKSETILIGESVKTVNGSVSRPVIYNTTQESDIDNLLTEARKSQLTQIFQGADLNRNIYRFDNSLFRVAVSIAFDKKWGSVDVQQKE